MNRISFTAWVKQTVNVHFMWNRIRLLFSNCFLAFYSLYNCHSDRWQDIVSAYLVNMPQFQMEDANISKVSTLIKWISISYVKLTSQKYTLVHAATTQKPPPPTSVALISETERMHALQTPFIFPFPLSVLCHLSTKLMDNLIQLYHNILKHLINLSNIPASLIPS